MAALPWVGTCAVCIAFVPAGSTHHIKPPKPPNPHSWCFKVLDINAMKSFKRRGQAFVCFETTQAATEVHPQPLINL